MKSVIMYCKALNFVAKIVIFVVTCKKIFCCQVTKSHIMYKVGLHIKTSIMYTSDDALALLRLSSWSISTEIVAMAELRSPRNSWLVEFIKSSKFCNS